MTSPDVAPAASDPDPPLDYHVERRTLRRAALLTSGAGIAFGVLAIASWLLLDRARESLADIGDPAEAFAAEENLGADVAALYLLPFAAIFFLWFIVALRGWIRGTQKRRNLLISDVQLVSGVVFTTVFLVSAGALATSVIATQDAARSIEPQSLETLRTLNGFGSTLMAVMGVRIAAIFVIATASLGMTASVLPRWFNILSYAFGIVLMLTPIVSSAFILAFPAWVIALSIMLLYHLINLPDDQMPGFAARLKDR